MIRFHVVPLVLCLGACSAGAQTVISVTGTSAGTDNELAVGQSSWTQTATYTGVTIQATLESCSGLATGTAYLTLNGTAAGNQIAINNALSVNTGDTPTTLFTGLTLGPGTYYLTLSPTSGECDEIWQNIEGTPAVAVGAGVTAGSSGGTGAGHLVAAYPPASTFGNSASFLFSVTFTGSTPAPSTTPAPASAILLGVGLLFLLLWYARRFRQQANTL